MKLSPLLTRQAHDSFAGGAHLASICFLIYGTQEFYSTALLGLLLMQTVSFAFHLFYIIMYYKRNGNEEMSRLLSLLFPQNKLKWLEYGISATAGAVAVIYANGSPSAGYLALLIIMSALQQYCGSIIDSSLQKAQDPDSVFTPNFLRVSLLITFASCLQVAEFVIVSYVGSPPFAVFISYVVGWSLFGVHCVIHASVTSQLALSGSAEIGTVSSFFLVRYGNRDWVEAVYSCLGWAAKIAVFSTEYVYLKNDREESDELHNVAIGFGTFALIATLLTTLEPPGNLTDNSMTSFL